MQYYSLKHLIYFIISFFSFDDENYFNSRALVQFLIKTVFLRQLTPRPPTPLVVRSVS